MADTGPPVAEIVSALALAVSLAAAFFTFRHERQALGVESYNRVTDLFLRMNDVFLAYPHLRPYFYSGRAAREDDPELDRVRAVAEHVADIFDWVSHCRLGASESDSAAWAAFIRATYAQSPALRDFHEAHRDWHPVLDGVITGATTADPADADLVTEPPP